MAKGLLERIGLEMGEFTHKWNGEKYYEQLPKPVLIAIQEYLNKELYYRNPEKEKIAAQCAAAESEEQNTVVENTDTVVAE